MITSNSHNQKASDVRFCLHATKRPQQSLSSLSGETGSKHASVVQYRKNSVKLLISV